MSPHTVLFTTLSVFSLCLLLNHLKVQLFPHYLIWQLVTYVIYEFQPNTSFADFIS